MRIPLVVQVKRHSLEDGPGIRTVVFFKGCPLRCRFCQNPETQAIEAQCAHTPERCVGCLACIPSCPTGALTYEGQGIRLDRTQCQPCAACADACPSGALQRVGRTYPVEVLCEILLRDRAYYRESGGGVTFSGGEATLFAEYVGLVASRLKPEGIHLCLESCGYFDYDTFARTLLPHLDMILFDVKVADPVRHKAITGVDNALIWDNLARLSTVAALRVVPRTPVIAGLTAEEENLATLRARVLALGLPAPILLPENVLGARMRIRLGVD